jgi:hypothetical protein
MSSESAFVGQPANTLADQYLIATLFDGHVPHIHAPPGYVYQTRGPGLAAGVSVAIFLVVLFTGIRLSIRTFHSRMKVGLDDWVIIPAAVSARTMTPVSGRLIQAICSWPALDTSQLFLLESKTQVRASICGM